MKLGKAASDVKIDIKLSTIKPIHASWIVASFQQVTKETLIRGREKTCIKEQRFNIVSLIVFESFTSSFMSEHKLTYC
jgi:hypothetical protein